MKCHVILKLTRPQLRTIREALEMWEVALEVLEVDWDDPTHDGLTPVAKKVLRKIATVRDVIAKAEAGGLLL